MSIDGTNKDIRNRFGADDSDLSAIGRWNKNYPRLSRVSWIALALLVVLPANDAVYDFLGFGLVSHEAREELEAAKTALRHSFTLIE